MAFRPEGLSREDLNLHKDHSRLITGTVAAIIAGHGYREEDDESHMEAILRTYARMRGEGVQRTKTNKAMKAGIELEPVAFDQLKNKLARGELEGYETINTADALSGMRLDDTKGEGFGFGANIDAPLVNTKGEKEDPTTGKTIPMVAYVAKWSRLEKDRQDITKSNEYRRMMGEPEIIVPENPLPTPPLAGVADLKATMSYDVNLEVQSTGPYAGWVAQIHWYNIALRAFNEKNGYDPDDYPNALMIGHMYSGDMETRLHPVPFDPKLESELLRRADVLIDCLNRGISPASPEMRIHFRPIPIKRFPPAAKLASQPVEEKTAKGFKQLDYCEDQLKHWEDLKAATITKLQALYEGEADVPGQYIYANGREMKVASSVRASNRINRDAVDGVINAAADTRTKVEKAIEAMEKGGMEEALKVLKAINLNSLPDDNVRSLDAYEVTTLKESEPKLTVKTTKKAQKVYDQLLKAEHRDDSPEEEPQSTQQTKPQEQQKESSSAAGKANLTTESPQGQVNSPDQEELNVPPALKAQAPKGRESSGEAQPVTEIGEYKAPEKTFALDPDDAIKVKPATTRTPNPFGI